MNDTGTAVDDGSFKRFFEISQELLCVADDQGRFLRLNPAWEKTFGWSHDHLLGARILDFVHPEDQGDAEQLLRGAPPGSVSPRSRFRRHDGEYRTLLWSVVVDDAGQLFGGAQDITDYVEAVAQSARNEELWLAVLRTAADPIIVIDETGVILRASDATNRLFGYSDEQMLGKNVSMLMPEPYRSEHDGYLRRYLDTGEARIIGIGREVEAQKADGTIFPMALAVSEVKLHSGRMFTGLIHDLTTRHLAERALREANERLEERVRYRTEELEALNVDLSRSNRDLEQFAYIASHDLQAPLRNVRQGLELLDDHLKETIGASFDAEAEELRDLTVNAVARMEALIHGLLSYSRLERSTRAKVAEVDLHALATNVIDEMRMDIENAGASITLNDLPTIRGDATQLGQLVQNLLQNALKYRATDRRAEITIDCDVEGADWVISVADNGLGVAQDQHEKIFELFRRGHAGYDGVGLGLAICQRIVERHGGDIWVKSEPDDGATFSFTLPRRESEAEGTPVVERG